jgi:hypothetical protein
MGAAAGSASRVSASAGTGQKENIIPHKRIKRIKPAILDKSNAFLYTIDFY